ncbi:hypothetical protein AAJP47_01045 [Psychrobacter sp. B38]|uniref:hypothetical protein n=1 Tax=Psychrobacter sp. B38 TaxID=3143538 RepID=UPI00320EFB71
MKEFVLISSLLLFGCGATEPSNQQLNTNKDNSNSINEPDVRRTSISSVDSINIPSNGLQSTYSNDDCSEILQTPHTKDYDYNAKKSLNKILNSGDPRKVNYLLHPIKQLLVYCYQNTSSECYIEGIHDGKTFKYDISQVEGQNRGKLTFHNNNIESSKTTPIKWMAVEDDYVMVLMTSKIIMNSQQYTLHEPLVIEYEAGMMVR